MWGLGEGPPHNLVPPAQQHCALSPSVSTASFPGPSPIYCSRMSLPAALGGCSACRRSLHLTHEGREAQREPKIRESEKSCSSCSAFPIMSFDSVPMSPHRGVTAGRQEWALCAVWPQSPVLPRGVTRGRSLSKLFGAASQTLSLAPLLHSCWVRCNQERPREASRENTKCFQKPLQHPCIFI